MEDSRTSNSIKNSGVMILGRIATMLMDFILRTVLIRCIGIQYGGVSTLFTDILQVLSLMELGLGGAIIYALYKPIADEDYPKINALMCFYRNAYNVIAISVFMLGLICIPFLGVIVKNVPNIKEDIRIIFMLYVLASSCSYLAIYKETLVKASQMSRVVVRIETILQIVFMGLESLMLLIFREYMTYLVLRVIFYLARNVLISREVKKRFPDVNFNGKERLNKEEKHRLKNDIAAMALYKISGVVLNGTDSIIISAFLGTGIVGIIGQYRMIQNFISNMSNNIWVSVLPSVGNLATTNNTERQYRVFSCVNFGSFVFAAIVSVGMFVLINPLVGLWVGKNYTVPIEIVGAIAFNMYLFLTILPFQTFRDANGLFVQGKYRPVIMSAINVGLSLLLVKPWGLFGVLFATPVSRLVTQTWFDPYAVYKYVFKRTPKYYYFDFAKHSMITLFCAWGSWKILTILSITNGLVNLVLGVGVCVFVTMVVYYILFCKSEQYIQLVGYTQKILRKIYRHILKR